MSYENSLQEVQDKTQSEMEYLRNTIDQAVRRFEKETGMVVVGMERVMPPTCSASVETLYWKIDHRLK